MQAGKLNKRIAIQQKISARDAAGGDVYEWQNIHDTPTVWAEKVDRSGLQGFESGQDLSKVTARFRIRYREDIEPSMRVVYKDKFYAIQYVLDLTGTHDFIELMCETGANDG